MASIIVLIVVISGSRITFRYSSEEEPLHCSLVGDLECGMLGKVRIGCHQVPLRGRGRWSRGCRENPEHLQHELCHQGAMGVNEPESERSFLL